MKKLLLALVGGALLTAGFAVGQNSSSELEVGKRWLTLMNHKGDTDSTISKAEFNR